MTVGYIPKARAWYENTACAELLDRTPGYVAVRFSSMNKQICMTMGKIPVGEYKDGQNVATKYKIVLPGEREDLPFNGTIDEIVQQELNELNGLSKHFYVIVNGVIKHNAEKPIQRSVETLVGS